MARTSKTSKNSPKALLKTPAKKPASSATKNASAANHDFPEVRSLIDLLKKNGLAVLEFEKGDFRITLKTPAGASSGSTLIQGHSSHALPAPPATPLPPHSISPEPSSEPAKGNYKEITSPMVGTFYASPSPESPSFVEAGATINADTVVCIIEAMKVMNEIKAEIAGKVVEVVAENGKPVQFGQVLFRVS